MGHDGIISRTLPSHTRRVGTTVTVCNGVRRDCLLTEAAYHVQPCCLRTPLQLLSESPVSHRTNPVELLQHLLLSHHKSLSNVVAKSELPIDEGIHHLYHQREGKLDELKWENSVTSVSSPQFYATLQPITRVQIEEHFAISLMCF